VNFDRDFDRILFNYFFHELEYFTKDHVRAYEWVYEENEKDQEGELFMQVEDYEDMDNDESESYFEVEDDEIGDNFI